MVISARGMWSRIVRVVMLVGAAGALAGCASSFPPAPSAAADEEYNYVVGSGDTLNIVVWRNPELSMSVPVRPDGKITTPLVEDLVAQGKDTTTLARDIEKELSKFIREPVVTVIATGFSGPYSEQIRVVGEAAQPRILPYTQKMTLLDVMIAVGGLTEYAAGDSARLIRYDKASNSQKEYAVKIQSLLKGGKTDANVAVQPGDVIIIPESFF